MDEKEREAWRECLALWNYIALAKDENELCIGIEEYKDAILNDLNIKPMMNGCPMCDKYLDRSNRSCTECPISIEFGHEYGACENSPLDEKGNLLNPNESVYNTPYGEWQARFPDVRDTGRQFHHWLINLAKKRGYYDSPNKL